MDAPQVPYQAGRAEAVAARHLVIRHRWAVLRLVVPPVLAVVLFAIAIATIVIPRTEAVLMDRKRETLRAIVASAVSLLERAAAEVGTADPAQVRARTAAELRSLRYGPDNKDYVWVIDDGLRMVAHPYRPDLEGRSLEDFTDAGGKRLFVESARAATQGDGFVEYLWQWQDDGQRIVPKLSYVRRFSAWGWIVGSGLYLDDVQQELTRTSWHLAWMTVGIGLAVAFLVGLGLAQGWGSERWRRLAEADLLAARARFEALAHAAAEAVWLVAEGRITGLNRCACGLLRREEGDLLGRAVQELFQDDGHRLLEVPDGRPREVLLATPEGPVPVQVSVSPAQVQGRLTLVFTAHPMHPDRQEDEERRRRVAAESLVDAAAEAQAAWQVPASSLAMPVPVLAMDAPQAGLVERIAASRSGAVLVAGPDGGLAGIVTTGDVVRRAGAGPAYRLMSAPVRTLSSDATLAEAAALVAEHGLGHVVLGQGGEDRQVVTARSLLACLRQGPVHLVAKAATAQQEELADLRRQGGIWARSLGEVGLGAERVMRMLTGLADAVLRRCAELVVAELGPPPRPCVLLAVGSQGRGEQLPGGDQDNALIFSDQGPGEPTWFSAFARRINARFQAAGWPLCQGGCLAGDPRWCLPASAWQARFTDWIQHRQPQDLLDFCIFVDFRPVWGSEGLAAELRHVVAAQVRSSGPFLPALAQQALAGGSPLGWFGSIRPDDQRHGTVSLKLAMRHFVDAARVLALANGVEATSTTLRLRQAVALGGATQAETLAAWHFLQTLRLGTRTRVVPDDHLDPESLPAWDHAQLKRALAVVDQLHHRLRQEFLGASGLRS